MAKLNLSSPSKLELLGSYDDHQSFIQPSVITSACIAFCLLPSLPTPALRDVGHGLSREHVQSKLTIRTVVNAMIYRKCYYLY